MGLHEIDDARCALGPHARGDVHQHHGAQHRLRRLALGDQRGDAAERGADRDRPVELPGDGAQVGPEMAHQVMPLRGAVAVAVAALVEADGPPAAQRQRQRGPAPGMAGLPAAMGQKHGRAIVVAQNVGGEQESFAAFEALETRRDRSGIGHRASSRCRWSPAAVIRPAAERAHGEAHPRPRRAPRVRGRRRRFPACHASPG